MMLRTLILIILSSTFSGLTAQNQFSKKQILEDLDYLKWSLEDAHYNLYAYTSKEEFDKNFNEVKMSVKKDSLNFVEAVSVFQHVTSKVNNGHTNVDFPWQSYVKYVYAEGTVFPLEIAFEYDKPLVRKNWSDNTEIKIGAEVISINGKSITEIIEKINPLISAERPYFKNTKIELYSFPRLYWQAFGKQDNFEVEIKYNGVVKKYSIQAVKAMDDYEMKRDEVLNASMKLEFYDNAAYLNPGNFGGDEDKYQHFIDSAFVKINERKSHNLIIDLRNNGGGEDSFSDYLVSYIADKPFKWNSDFTLKTSKFLKEHTRENMDTTEAYWQAVLNHKDGEIYSYEFDEYQPQPKEKRFNGKVYVLVNRQSHSQSAVTGAQIQDYGFATIVGEETGDYPSLYASIYKYPLPNTGIEVYVSKGYIVRVNGSKKQEGVIPDIFIKDHLLDEKDEILEGLQELIESNN